MVQRLLLGRPCAMAEENKQRARFAGRHMINANTMCVEKPIACGRAERMQRFEMSCFGRIVTWEIKTERGGVRS